MYQAFQNLTRELEPGLIRFTQEIVRTPSYSLAEAGVAGRFHKLLDELQYDHVFRDGAGNVIGILVGSDPGPTVLLNSHMDTVECGEGSDDPMSGRIQEGRMYGIGAADCKSGLAAQAFAGHILARSGLPVHGDIVVAGTVAEENGCSVGSRHLLENTLPKLGIQPALAILGEPTDLGLFYGHDGWVKMQIRVSGSDRAAVRLGTILIIFDLKEAGGDLGVQNGGIYIEDSEPELRLTGEEYESTISVTRRIFPGVTASECVEQMQRRVAAALKPTQDLRFDACAHTEHQQLYTGMAADVVCQTEPWITDPLQPMFDRARQALTAAGWKKVPVETWNLKKLGMGTSGNLLASAHRIPTVGFGPGEVSQAHARNESVSVENLTRAAYGTAVLVHSLIGAPLNELVHN